jgi:hypothetical protein
MKQVTLKEVRAAGKGRKYPSKADAATMTPAQYVARFQHLNRYAPRSKKA